MTPSEEKALKAFDEDINGLNKLEPWINKFNLFDMLKISNMEIRHSNILAWLLDPNENHGLGDSFIMQFVSRIVDSSGKNDKFNLSQHDFSSYQVYRESNHIDILLVSHKEKSVVVIENKIWAGESDHQLEDYYKIIETDYPEYSRLYVFLTPDGRESKKMSDVYIPISYEYVIDSFNIQLKEHMPQDEIRIIIDNYIQMVRRNVMQQKDEQLVKVCNEIYLKHKTALKLIYDNVEVNDSSVSDIICGTLKEMEEEHIILYSIYNEKNSWHFFTDEMNDFLPALDDAKSSWGTRWVYYFWFDKPTDKLTLHFELGGLDLPEDRRENMQKLIDLTGKNGFEFQYRRLKIWSEKLKDDNYEENLKKAVKSLVKAALKWEKDILNEASKRNK